MRLAFNIISVGMTGILLTGCGTTKKEVSVAPPPTSDQAASLKAVSHEVNPRARVGIITAVITESPLTMIDQISPDEVKPGDVFSIVGSSDTVVANAVVEKIIDGKIAARYEPVVRPPLVGDLAVKF